LGWRRTRKSFFFSQKGETTMIHLIHADFRTHIPLLKTNFFSLVLTDPPYARQYLPLWGSLAFSARKVLKESGFFVSYSGNAFLPQVFTSLSSSLDYYWLGMVKHSVPGRQSSRNVENWVKPMLVFNKPPSQTPPGTFVDLLEMGRREKDYHPWQQPLDEARELVRSFSKPGDWILDPCVGSGTTLLAAHLEGRNAIGIEIDRKVCAITWDRLKDAGVEVKVPNSSREASKA
jgi:site-specific DNA-methyltransferase (adenine-specific)